MAYSFDENNFLSYTSVFGNNGKIASVELFTHSATPVILEKERIVIFITILKQAALGKLKDSINIASNFQKLNFTINEVTYTKLRFYALLEFSQLKNNNTVYLEVLLKSFKAKDTSTDKMINLVIPPKKTLTNFEIHYYIELFSKMNIAW